MAFGGIKILVLDRGHVKVARLSQHEELPFHWRLLRGRIIRRWGTSKGLHELCNGPLEATQLDNPADSTVPWRAVIDIIDVDESKWEKYL